MTCARTGDARAVKALLAHGADVEREGARAPSDRADVGRGAKPPGRRRLLIEARADVRARSLTYPQTVVGEQTQRAGREELNYTVLRGGATPLLFAARVGDAESASAVAEGRRGRRTTRSRTASARWCSPRTAARAAWPPSCWITAPIPTPRAPATPRCMRPSSEAIWRW